MPRDQITTQDGAASLGLMVKNIRKSYLKKLVLRDVSISLGRGEVAATGLGVCGAVPWMMVMLPPSMGLQPRALATSASLVYSLPQR